METLQKKAQQEIFFLKLDYNQLQKIKEIIEESGELKSLTNVINFKIAKNNYYKEKYKNKLDEMMEMQDALN
mgnify:CR=1 FL=1|tara:strand:+ start:164 stop:379 length:216 start_codon:yes stop_codon:yes gene_type:complete